MRSKQIKVELLLAAVLLLIASGLCGVLVRPSAEPDQTLRSRFGDVVWNHELHARMKEINNCTACHHTERQGVTNPRPCGDCHSLEDNREAVIHAGLFVEPVEKTYAGEQGPPAMHVFHAKCLGCHKAMNEGPVSCRDCHNQTFSGNLGIVAWDHRTHARKMDISCVRCHHKDTEAASDADYRACGDCHTPALVKGLTLATGLVEHEDAKHGKCHTCHTISNPENDARSCVDCHGGLALPEENSEEAPSLEQALHGRCMECHSMDYPDLEPTMPVLCTDCHKPDPSMITLEGSKPILWSHKRHAEYTEWECNRCHHTDIPDEPHMACRSCHGTGQFAGIPDLHEAMSRNCIDCHKEQGAGLTSWESLEGGSDDLSLFIHREKGGEERTFWWDHRFHAVGAAISCRACHHNTMVRDGRPETAALALPGVADDATHFRRCTDCHGDHGPVPGSPADGSEAPPYEEAFQALCLNCHQELECGPLTWDELHEMRGLDPHGKWKMEMLRKAGKDTNPGGDEEDR